MIKSVCVFGDSVSKGVVFDDVRKKYIILKDSFVSVIEHSTNIAINNYSKFGYTITRGNKLLKRHESELSQYDYTLLEFGGNDCNFNWEEISAEPEGLHLPNTPLPDFEHCYSELIDEVKKSGGKPVLLSLPPIDAKKYFAWISGKLNSDNILNWLGDVEYLYRWHEMYNLAVNRLAIVHSIPLIDISSTFLKTENYQNLICEDGIHPNKNGHKLISEAIEHYVLAYT